MEDETIKEYLANKDIVVTGFSFKGSVTDYSEERVINHVRLINAMHKILMEHYVELLLKWRNYWNDNRKIY